MTLARGPNASTDRAPSEDSREGGSRMLNHDTPLILQTATSQPVEPMTFQSGRVRFESCWQGFQLFTPRRTLGGIDCWEIHLALRWAEVLRLSFDRDRYDPILSLYAYLVCGPPRRHVLDATRLDNHEWPQLRDIISLHTGGRVVLELPAGKARPWIGDS
jgi:hypothetical protein